MIGIEELVAQAQKAFGWNGRVGVAAGPRGALGQIWRLEVGSARYALKHIFDEPPTEASIRAALDLVDRARDIGVRRALSARRRSRHSCAELIVTARQPFGVMTARPLIFPSCSS